MRQRFSVDCGYIAWLELAVTEKRLSRREHRCDSRVYRSIQVLAVCLRVYPLPHRQIDRQTDEYKFEVARKTLFLLPVAKK